MIGGDSDRRQRIFSELGDARTALRNFGGVGSGPFCITVLDDEVFVPDSATQTIFVKPVQTDDAAPEEAYKIKASVPFSYVAS